MKEDYPRQDAMGAIQGRSVTFMEDPRAKQWRWWERALLARLSPHQLALGLCLGWLLGYLPKDNLLAVGLFLVPLFTRANIILFSILAIVGWQAIPLLDPMADALGSNLMQQQSVRGLLQWIDRQPVFAWLGLNQTVVVGVIAMAIPICPMMYLTTERTFSLIRYLYRKQQHEQLLASLVGYRRQLVNLIYHKVPIAESATISSHFVIGESLEDVFAARSATESTTPPVVREPATEKVKWDGHNLDGQDHLRIDQQHAPTQDIKPTFSEQTTVTSSGHETPVVRKPLSEWRTEYLEAALDELRVDASHDASVPGPSRPAPVKARELEAAAAAAASASAASMRLGDVLQETSIDIVRIKTSQEVSQGPSAKLPDMTTHSTSTTGVQDTLIVHSTTDGSSHPPVPMAFEKREREASPPKVPPRNELEPTQAASNESPSEPSSSFPAEESLRHLLWHLTESKRGAKS